MGYEIKVQTSQTYSSSWETSAPSVLHLHGQLRRLHNDQLICHSSEMSVPLVILGNTGKIKCFYISSEESNK